MSNIHICEFYKGKIIDITTDRNLNPYCRRCGKPLKLSEVDKKWRNYLNAKKNENDRR